ncbi:hypothetical protein SEVIR_1G178200v4 [Setaria viridis]|uniref:C2 domain-containing protein n=2 Tax=Setaria TaxID=4554 RepID=K3YU97_SETIT|nr:uncharacterized protein LOC101761919 [Setaria italica]XP_034590486.1 uncharacterized protein LOC117852484 [Setaria viridis]RCV06593.1 hypothetical protein SETIT_1G175300v2 [Setaria italica]TKW39428.1 hypothetical protein SEVIR_1G178200v2 [Setaria viridis]
MERSPRRRPKPAAIDITWVSCRGVRSSLPFHTPCLYVSVFVAPSSARGVHGHRRPHRVKTPTDRAGGVNPEWDAPLRLYLPDASSPPADEAELAAGKNSKKGDGDDDVLLLRFEIKAEVAVLGDKLTASAAVPVPGLVADGCTRRVSYQLAGPDGRQPNGVISFSYAFHDSRNGGDDDDGHSSDSEPVATPPSPCPTESSSSTSPLAHPLPPTTAAPRLYPAIEWPPAEQIIPIYPPPVTAEAAVTNSRYYPPPVEPVAVYPPSAGTAWSCSLYPPAGEAVPASGMYPTVDLAPVSCYPPAVYGVECGYAAAPPV